VDNLPQHTVLRKRTSLPIASAFSADELPPPTRRLAAEDWARHCDGQDTEAKVVPIRA
jgi:hypothetical protein